MKTFENAQVGDEVWSSIYGVGVVVEIDLDYTIEVHFCNDILRSYDFDGLNHTQDTNPSLFWQEQTLDFDTKRPEPKVDWLKVPRGTAVIVGAEMKRERVFVTYLPQGGNKFACFGKGRSNENAMSIGYHYKCKIADGVKIKKEWLK